MDRSSRPAPPKVAPITMDGVRYSQVLNARKHGLPGGAGWLMASKPDSGEVLWTLQVYKVHIDPADETDVQEVYFSSMERVKGRRALKIRNEAGQSFIVDVATREVTPLP